ncbi:MAG: hypothetical protein K8R87_02340 [Verrucomicrobia bacterium]|nr:hypothetical protein [Verrucomicrobiota bacterium]
MKTKLLTILAATTGLVIAGFALSSQAGPSESIVQARDAGSKVTAPVSCHATAKAEADHCTAGANTCDHAAKSGLSGESHAKTCCAHGDTAPAAMNCPMHAKMKGCSMGGSH